jgi:hypothetical protein
MNKSLTAAVVGCMAVVACLGLFFVLTMSGCDTPVDADVENKPVDTKQFGERPIDPNRIVDSQVSWKKFVAEYKQAERIQSAEKKFQETGPANNVKIVFMKDEIEYVVFGDKSRIKGIEPNRLYEVGVVTLAAKENWGADGFQIREYKLRFITPRRDGDWKYIEGTYKVSKFSGNLAGDPTQLRYVEDKEYQNGYLRLLFVKPLVGKPAAGAPVNQNPGGEQPVETKIQPQP